MIRSCVLVVVAMGLGGCTLLLPTGDLIKPCVEQAECDDGFVCQDEACLPEDDAEAGASG
jgi:hypothetical protein